MGTKEALWDLDDHTKGKHVVLKGYLDAWLPILSRYNGRVLFIDGFAGPGAYREGQDGSPLIAIRCVREHTASALIKEVVCIFIEADERRAAHLCEVLNKLKDSGQVPDTCKVFIEHGTFDEKLTKVLDIVEEQKTRLAPTFVMIDPFGVSDTPMSVIDRLFKNDRVEVYVSFMYEWLNRFKGTPEFEPHMDRLFGTSDWRSGLGIEDASERKVFFFDLYERQLRKAGASYVVRLELFSGNRLKYAIFFGTHHLLGADKMKQVIWRIAPTGDYAFRGGHSDQLALGLETVDFAPLRAAVEGFLKGRPAGAWVEVGDVQKFVIADTDYHSSQYKSNALKPLESAGTIEVDPTSRRRKGTYPDGTRVRWKH
jgi:three-Cys-motif partner protein